MPRRNIWEWAQKQRLLRAYTRFMDAGGGVLAAGMSYQALFAVFAGLYLGFSILGIWLREQPALFTALIDHIALQIPGLIGEHALSAEELRRASRVLDWTGVVAAGSLLWVSLSWFTGTRRAIRIIFKLEVTQYRSEFMLKLRDLLLATAFLTATLVSAALTAFSSNIAGWVVTLVGGNTHNWLLGGLGVAVRYLALYVFDVLVLVAIHRLLAEITVHRWRLLRGCLGGGSILFVLKLLGTTLFTGTANNPLLAPFAVLIGMLIWLNLICRTLLFTASWIAVGEDLAHKTFAPRVQDLAVSPQRFRGVAAPHRPR